jgi:hypothetical protein
VRRGLEYFKQQQADADRAALSQQPAGPAPSEAETGTALTLTDVSQAGPEPSPRWVSERPPLPIGSIPGVQEAFWTPDQGQLSRCPCLGCCERTVPCMRLPVVRTALGSMSGCYRSWIQIVTFWTVPGACLCSRRVLWRAALRHFRDSF